MSFLPDITSLIFAFLRNQAMKKDIKAEPKAVER